MGYCDNVEDVAEKRGMGKTEGRMPRDYKWEVQLASRKNKKGRVIGGMLMGIRRG